MKTHNKFETRNDYLKYMKRTFQNTGMKCMVSSLLALMLLIVLRSNWFDIAEKVLWGVQRIITGGFVIGAIGYLVSFAVKCD